MNFHIERIRDDHSLWADMSKLFPRAIVWLNNSGDHGDYHFFAAVDEASRLLGGCVMDIGRMGFGPLSDMPVGFLEDIKVLEDHQRKGIATSLLRTALDYAWQHDCRNVRWTVDYENTAGIALYEKLGFSFIPDEDPEASDPARQYIVVATPN